MTIPTVCCEKRILKQFISRVEALMVEMAMAKPIPKCDLSKDSVNPSKKHRRRSPDVFGRLMILIGINGRTQGVRFKNKSHRLPR